MHLASLWAATVLRLEGWIFFLVRRRGQIGGKELYFERKENQLLVSQSERV